MMTDKTGYFLSIIIPTYNRNRLIVHTVDSALEFCKMSMCNNEIIVVDDGSTDSTIETLTDRYQNEIDSAIVKIMHNNRNLGVTKARNEGISSATGDWLLFLDSDDLLIPDTSKQLIDILRNYSSYGMILFRCECLETGQLIGPSQVFPYELTLSGFLNRGTPGECLPVLKTSYFSNYLYYPNLNGCEGYTYACMIRDLGSIRIDPLIARRYRTGNNDRLSSSKGIIRRACHLATFNRLLMTQFFEKLFISTLLTTVLKMICYWSICQIGRIIKSLTNITQSDGKDMEKQCH